MPSAKKIPTAIVAARLLQEGGFADQLRRGAFAKLIHCAASYVTKLIHEGKLGPDCLTDDERYIKVRPALEAIVAADTQGAPAMPISSLPEAALGISPSEARASSTSRKMDAAAEREALKLQRERLDFERDLGNLVDRAALEEGIYNAGVGLKSRLHAMARKCQESWAVETDPFKLGDQVIAAMDQELSEFSRELATAIGGAGESGA